MKNKKVFRIPLIFVIEFRLAFILLIFFLVCCVGFAVGSIREKNLLCSIGFILFIILDIYWFNVYFIPILFPMAFGKLIISDQGVEFRCIFTKKTSLSWDECEFCGIEGYKNVVKDLYGTGRVYIYFSKNELPQEFRGNITKKKNSEGFIKFFPVTVELCEEILRHKNFQDVRRFVIQKTFNKKG
jgi:predicted membrane protein